MKFTIQDPERLWKAIQRVMKATPRRYGEENAMCLEVTDDILYVHRYSADAYAEHKVDILTTEHDGKIVIGDVNPIKFIRGLSSFEANEKTLTITDLVNPANVTTIQLTYGDPFLYCRISYPEESVEITSNLHAVGWPEVPKTTSKDGDKTLSFIDPTLDWIMIDGKDVIATDRMNHCLVSNDEPLIDGHLFVTRDFFQSATIGSRIATEGQRVWILDGAFKYYNSTVQNNLPAGYFRNGIMEKLATTNAQVKVKKSEILEVLEFITYISTTKDYQNGACRLQLSDNKLTIVALGNPNQQATRIIFPESYQGDFSVALFPKMLKEAIGATESGVDEVTIEAWLHPEHLRYAVLVYTANVYSFIPSIADKWEEKNGE